MTSSHSTMTPLGAPLGAQETPARTAPLAEAHRGAWFEGADPVTALRVYDGALEFEWPDGAHQLIGASGKCAISLPGLSAKHCLLEPRGDRLRLVDMNSTHGMYYQDRRVQDITVAAGDTFTLPPFTFLVLNDEMRKHRPTIVDIVGTGATPSPDKLLIEAVRGSSNLIVTGEANSDLDQFAGAIHAVSLRRRQNIVEIIEVPEDRAKQRAVIESAARSTLVISIAAGQRRLDPTFCSLALSPPYHVRVIVLAPSIDVAWDTLGRDAFDHMQHVWVRPLVLRSTEIDRLLDRIFERHSTLRVANLTPANLAALRAHDWPDNLAGLRRIVTMILAHATHHGLRPAARSLRMPPSTLHDQLVRIGLSFPLFVD